MTTPKIETVYRGGSRYYVHPETGDVVPGVTSILSMRAKPFLMAWAAKMTAEVAVASLDVLPSMVAADRQGAIDFLKGASRRNTKQAGEVGTAAHGVFERLANGETLGTLTPDLQPFAAHFSDFLATMSPEIVYQEETVWSEAHSYAGSFDAIMTVEGRLVFADWKTTRSGVHEDAAWQLAAYRHADYILTDDGQVLKVPSTDGAVVLHVRPEGWGLYTVDAGEETFEEFLAFRAVHRQEKEKKGRTLISRRPVYKGAGRVA